MAVDQRILDKFQEEYLASKKRAEVEQAKVVDLTNQLSIANAALQSELDLQAAMNAALQALGQVPLP